MSDVSDSPGTSVQWLLRHESHKMSLFYYLN